MKNKVDFCFDTSVLMIPEHETLS